MRDNKIKSLGDVAGVEVARVYGRGARGSGEKFTARFPPFASRPFLFLLPFYFGTSLRRAPRSCRK